jgi:hypothetical protein
MMRFDGASSKFILNRIKLRRTLCARERVIFAAPPAVKKNGLPTRKGKAYFVILRLFGPHEPALNRTRVPST